MVSRYRGSRRWMRHCVRDLHVITCGTHRRNAYKLLPSMSVLPHPHKVVRCRSVDSRNLIVAPCRCLRLPVRNAAAFPSSRATSRQPSAVRQRLAGPWRPERAAAAGWGPVCCEPEVAGQCLAHDVLQPARGPRSAAWVQASSWSLTWGYADLVTWGSSVARHHSAPVHMYNTHTHY